MGADQYLLNYPRHQQSVSHLISCDWTVSAKDTTGHGKVIAMKLLLCSSTRSWLLLKPASFRLGDLQITTTRLESLHYIRYDHLKRATWLWCCFLRLYGVLDLDPWTLYPKLIDHSLIPFKGSGMMDGKTRVIYLYEWYFVLYICKIQFFVLLENSKLSATSNLLWMSIPTRKRDSMAISRLSAIQFTKFSET